MIGEIISELHKTDSYINKILVLDSSDVAMHFCIIGIGGCGRALAETFLEDQDVSFLGYSFGIYPDGTGRPGMPTCHAYF